ncbi:Gpr1 family protein [Auriculariales sp. MPI-PUGE-AT-0066]|nr:Gpr1 family protein [Auriculariales sp. MPI-PUGE-AT-0066]
MVEMIHAQANPTPLGLYAYAITNLLGNLYTINTRGISNGNLIIGMAISCGGLAQFMAGMWDFANSNTLGGTSFTIYGTFWMSYGLMHIPGLNSVTSYAGESADQLPNAMGIYFAMWFLISALFTPAFLRSSVVTFSMFVTLDLMWMFLMIASFTGSDATRKVGGWSGIVSCCLALYEGTCILYTSDVTPIRLPRPMMPFAAKSVDDTESDIKDKDGIPEVKYSA